MPRRALRAAATLLAAFLLGFVLLHAMPGDPRDRLEDVALPREQADRMRRALGLDDPLPEQLVRTLAAYARGELGVSFTRHRPVAEVLAGALPASVALGSAALAIAYAIGLALALLAVRMPEATRERLDAVLLALAVVPRYWLGVLLVLVFHAWAGWLPASHAMSPGGGSVIDRLRHVVLPALALGAPGAAVVARLALASMARLRDAPHVVRARASGERGIALLVRHVLRPAAAPILALVGLDLPALVSGAVVVEIVFSWPGAGRLTAEAILAADYPLALAGAVLAAVAVVLGRAVAEGLARRLDPRLGALSADLEAGP